MKTLFATLLICLAALTVPAQNHVLITNNWTGSLSVTGALGTISGLVPASIGSLDYLPGEPIGFIFDSGSNHLVSAPLGGVWQMNVTTDALLPAWGLESSDPGTFFYAGLATGFAFGGTAFVLRLVRQVGRHSPEV